MNESKYFAVIDVETNWDNEAMSIGLVIANSADYSVADKRYYILYPECKTGGFYSDVLRDVDKSLIADCSRSEAVKDIDNLLDHYRVSDILAYNAPFDYKCMPELHRFTWRDILPIAANRNFNDKLPDNCEFFSTGLLKRGRSLENILRLIYFRGYTEMHNGLADAIDELLLIKIIALPIDVYREYKPKQTPIKLVRKSTSRIREPNLLSAYKYVLDELCGGTVKLINIALSTDCNAVAGQLRPERLYLECSRCGYKWEQDAEEFFRSPKCPECCKK